MLGQGAGGGKRYNLADLHEGDKLLHDVEAKLGAGRICMYFWFGLLGTLAGALLGFFVFVDPGGPSDGTDTLTVVLRVAATVGGLVGGLLAAFFGTGDLGREMDTGVRSIKQVTGALLPGVATAAIYGHSAFTLFVTVHHAKNVKEVGGLVPQLGALLKTYDAFVTVQCGDNPDKATCVRNDETFNETFKLLVSVSDQHLTVMLKDQDIVHDDIVGAAHISIVDIINAGFPVFKSYNLADPRGAKSGQVTLSFDWGDDFSRDKLEYLRESHPVEFERRQALRQNTGREQAKLTRSVMEGHAFASRAGGDAAGGMPRSGDFAAGVPRGNAYGTFSEVDCKRVLQGQPTKQPG